MTAPHRDARSENFPVASWLVAARHRPAIMAFYRFARTADDTADEGDAAPSERLAGLEAMRATLAGEADASPPAAELRRVLAGRGLEATHALDLLAAFRRDVANVPVASWDDLIGYCALSAMPVGRFVLDVHGEDRAVWALSDPLCAALQVINHLQDCGDDWRNGGRLYLPADWLAEAGADPADLVGDRATPALAAVIARALAATEALLDASAGFGRALRDRRLGLEVAVIHRLARDLVARLRTRDPLATRVAPGGMQAALVSALAVGGALLGRGR